MRKRSLIRGFLGLLILGAGHRQVFAGDSVYGKVRSVSGELVTFNHRAGTYVIRIAGIEVPPTFRAEETTLVDRLLGATRNARMRLVRREKNGEMVSQLLTDNPDPKIGIRDLGVELLREGLARRFVGPKAVSDEEFGYKYGELEAAEAEARKAPRGLWAPPRTP